MSNHTRAGNLGQIIEILNGYSTRYQQHGLYRFIRRLVQNFENIGYSHISLAKFNS